MIPELTSRSFCFTAECEIVTSRLILAPQTIPACPAVLFTTFRTLGFRVQMLSISQLASLVKLVSSPAWMPGLSPRNLGKWQCIFLNRNFLFLPLEYFYFSPSIVPFYYLVGPARFELACLSTNRFELFLYPCSSTDPKKLFIKSWKPQGFQHLTIWRSRWDSNSRKGLPFAGFQDQYNKPLCHYSIDSLFYQTFTCLSRWWKRRDSNSRPTD